LLAFPDLTGQRSHLNPPEYLTDDERTAFVEVVDACDPSHFRASDLPLVAAYAQAAVKARKLAGERNPLKGRGWIETVRLLVTLATKLRLSPQARIQPRTVGRQEPHDGPNPWGDY
jgi:hypothetical protein